MLTSGPSSHHWQSFSLVFITLGILCVGFLHFFTVDDPHARTSSSTGCRNSQSSNKSSSRTFPCGGKRMSESRFLKKYWNLDFVFPEVIKDDSLFLYFLNEVKKCHRWVSLCFYHEPHCPRQWNYIFLASTANCILFFNALIFSWLHPEENVCDAYVTKEDCLMEPSKLAIGKSMCYWSQNIHVGVEGSESSRVSCVYREATSHGNLMMTIATISSILSIPFIVLLDAVVFYILCRPVLSIQRVEPSSDSDDSFSEGNWRSEIDHTFNRRFCSRNRSKIGVAYDSQLLHDVTSDLQQLVCDLSAYRTQLKLQYVPEFDARWGFTSSDIQNFLSEVSSHRYLYLTDESVVIDEDVNDVVVGKMRFPRLWCDMSQSNSICPKFSCVGFSKLWNELLHVRMRAQSEVVLLQNSHMLEFAIVDRILILFKQDMMRGVSSEMVSGLLQSSSPGSFAPPLCQRLHPVSRWTRVMGVVVFSAVNAVFLWYTLSYVMHMHKEGPSKLLHVFIIWLALEVVVVCTLYLLVYRVVVPLFVSEEMKQVYGVVRAVALKVFEDKSSSEHVSRANERNITTVPPVASHEPFNIAPYLFVSRQVVDRLPDSMQRRIVRHFRSVIPNRPYSLPIEQLPRTQLYLRSSALIQSVSVFMVYVASSFLLVIPHADFYALSVFNWLILGYLSDVHGISVFSDMILLIAVLCIFVAMLYKVGVTLMFIGKVIADNLKSMKGTKAGSVSTVGKERVMPLACRANIFSEDGTEFNRDCEFCTETPIDETPPVYTEEDIEAAFYYLEAKGINIQFGDDFEAHMVTARRMMAEEVEEKLRLENEAEEEVGKAFDYLESKGIDILSGDDFEAYMIAARRMMADDAKEETEKLRLLEKNSSHVSTEPKRVQEGNSGLKVPRYTEEEVGKAFDYLESKGIDILSGDDFEAYMIAARRMMADDAKEETEKLRLLEKNSSHVSTVPKRVQEGNSGLKVPRYTEEEVGKAFDYLESKGIDIMSGDDFEAYMIAARRMMADDAKETAEKSALR